MAIELDNDERRKAFLEDILAVYAKHGLAISHEDGHGGFLIAKDSDWYRNWLMQAAWEETDDKNE